MQYVLGLAILCKKYKKNPIVRLFINNQFIDEFIIDDTTKLFKGPAEKSLQINFSNKYKIFEVDENIFKNDSKIRFEIQNKDSNYVNGFMTKSTLISIECIFLIPKTLLKRYNLIWKTFYKLSIPKDTLLNSERYYESIAAGAASWAKVTPTVLLDTPSASATSNVGTDEYPKETYGANDDYVIVASSKPARLFEKIDGLWYKVGGHFQGRATAGGWPLASIGRQFNKPISIYNSWIGDDATIEFNIQKKHGIYMFFDPEEAGCEFLSLSRLISGLCSFENFDKYLHES